MVSKLLACLMEAAEMTNNQLLYMRRRQSALSNEYNCVACSPCCGTDSVALVSSVQLLVWYPVYQEFQELLSHRKESLVDVRLRSQQSTIVKFYQQFHQWSEFLICGISSQTSKRKKTETLFKNPPATVTIETRAWRITLVSKSHTIHDVSNRKWSHIVSGSSELCSL